MQHLPLRDRPQFCDVTRALGQAAVGAFSLAPQLVSTHWWTPRRRDRSDPGAAALHRLSERKSPSPVLNVFEAGNKVLTGIGRSTFGRKTPNEVYASYEIEKKLAA